MSGIQRCDFPIRDPARSNAQFTVPLSVAAYLDAPSCVGLRAGNAGAGLLYEPSPDGTQEEQHAHGTQEHR